MMSTDARMSSTMTTRSSRITGTGQAYVTSTVAAIVLLLLGAFACGAGQPPAAHTGAPQGSGGVNRPEHRDKPSLVLVSVDGFRADYLQRQDLPNFRRAVARGTRASAMRPVFPTTTFPNHYSLVTGMHPGHHGIVENSFFDPVRNAVYSFRNPLTAWDGSWYGGEPIWVTAERQGMVAACFFWPGSEADIKGLRATYWNKYDGSIANERRVDTVLEWLRLPSERRPRLVTLYFSDVDSASHRSRLDGDAVTSALRQVDTALGQLLDGLDRLSVHGGVVLLLTSDHGMAHTAADRVLQIGDLVDMTGLRVGFTGPVMGLHTGPGSAGPAAVRDAINAKLRHGRAYRRQDLPERYGFRDSPRGGDVVIVMDEGWMIMSSVLNRSLIDDEWGEHGWDPALPSMSALFAISGPGITAGAVAGEVENVDVYPLMTELLGLRPAPGIDGRTGRIRRALEEAARP